MGRFLIVPEKKKRGNFVMRRFRTVPEKKKMHFGFGEITVPEKRKEKNKNKIKKIFPCVFTMGVCRLTLCRS